MRLTDPKGLVSPDVLRALNAKLDMGMVGLATDPRLGGNPFCYSFVATKPHELAVEYLSQEVKTAATDGKIYLWNPVFLATLPARELPLVMEHETIHLICDHAGRIGGRIPKLWMIVIDFITNGLMARDLDSSNRWSKVDKNKRVTILDSSLGKPINVKTFIEYLKGEIELDGHRIFLDKEASLGTPEDLYEKLLPYWKENPQTQSQFEAGENKAGLDPSDEEGKEDSEEDEDASASGQEGSNLDPLDTHVSNQLSKQEMLDNVQTALDQAALLNPGSEPGYLKDVLGELTDPSINLCDHIRMSCLNKQKGGTANRWKRPRRRSWAIGQYLPTHISPKEHANWLCLLDTSVSMSQSDISSGISQLKSINVEFSGIIVPCDAAVHWDQATEVDCFDDLKNTKIVGRGGTVFDEFFVGFPERFGEEFDVIIIITDGYCPPIKKELEPSIDVVWAVAGKNKTFKPPFGEVIPICQDGT